MKKVRHSKDRVRDMRKTWKRKKWGRTSFENNNIYK